MSDLYLDECDFIGAKPGGNALRISPWSGCAVIRNCKFERCGQRDPIIGRPHGAASCIDICGDEGYEGGSRYGSLKPCIKFKCIGCVFKNNRGYTVAIVKGTFYDVLSNIDIKNSLN